MRLLSLMMVVVLIGSGCTRTPIWVRELRHHEQLGRANEAFLEGRWAQAAALYESLADRYPAQSERRRQFMLRQGIALYRLSDYHDARDVFLRIIGEFPNTAQAADARAYIGKIDIYMSSEAPPRLEAGPHGRTRKPWPRPCR